MFVVPMRMVRSAAVLCPTACIYRSILFAGSLLHSSSGLAEQTTPEDLLLDHEEEDYETLYLLFGVIAVCTVVLQLTELPLLRSLPGTVVFFILGVALGFAMESGMFDEFHRLRNSYQAWADVDPHLLLFTFLPPLLFSDAMARHSVFLRYCKTVSFFVWGDTAKLYLGRYCQAVSTLNLRSSGKGERRVLRLAQYSAVVSSSSLI